MKYILILLTLFFSACLKADAQTILSDGYLDFGYHKTGKVDTVRAVVLYTVCDACPAYSAKAYAVREEYAYYGDTMGRLYAPYWVVIKLLTELKTPFSKQTIVWQSKIIQP